MGADIDERLSDRFDEEYRTSDEPADIGFLVRMYKEHPETRKGIDHALISTCGWSLPTLVQKAGVRSIKLPKSVLNPITREGVIYGKEAQELHKEQMQEMRAIAKQRGKRVAAGLYGSLWCPICKQYTSQTRYITPGGSERFRCITGDHTFSRGRHGWLEQYNPCRRRNPPREAGVFKGLIPVVALATVVIAGVAYLGRTQTQ